MTSQADLIPPELVGNSYHIRGKLDERVGADPTRFTALVVAPLVRRDDAIAGASERIDLAVPAIPEFGKTVEQKNDWVVLRTRGDGVKLHASIAKVQSL